MDLCVDSGFRIRKSKQVQGIRVRATLLLFLISGANGREIG